MKFNQLMNKMQKLSTISLNSTMYEFKDFLYMYSKQSSDYIIRIVQHKTIRDTQLKY